MLLDKILTAIFGSQNDRDVKALKPILEAVNAQEDWAKSLPPESFPEQTKRFKEELASGKTLDDILPQAFALAREAASRVRKSFRCTNYGCYKPSHGSHHRNENW